MIAYSLNKGSHSDFYALVLFLLGIASFLPVSMLFLPFGLLFGPLLLGFSRKLGLNRLIPHLIPYLLHLIYKSSGIAIEKTEYYVFTAVSILIYSIVVISTINRPVVHPPVKKAAFLLSSLSIFIGIFCLMLGLREQGLIQPEFSIEVLIRGLHLICFVILGHYYIISLRSQGVEKTSSRPKDAHEVMERGVDTEAVSHRRLSAIITEKKLFLDANLTPQKLAREYGVQKHELDAFFAAQPQVNFRSFLAKFRIKHAIERMEQEDTLTLESLAYESGFNSKTTFTKYFKQYTGVVPSVYRARIQKQQ